MDKSSWFWISRDLAISTINTEGRLAPYPFTVVYFPNLFIKSIRHRRPCDVDYYIFTYCEIDRDNLEVIFPLNVGRFWVVTYVENVEDNVRSDACCLSCDVEDVPFTVC